MKALLLEIANIPLVMIQTDREMGALFRDLAEQTKLVLLQNRADSGSRITLERGAKILSILATADCAALKFGDAFVRPAFITVCHLVNFGAPPKDLRPYLREVLIFLAEINLSEIVPKDLFSWAELRASLRGMPEFRRLDDQIHKVESSTSPLLISMGEALRLRHLLHQRGLQQDLSWIYQRLTFLTKDYEEAMQNLI